MQPERGDAVEAWLKENRDIFLVVYPEDKRLYRILDSILDTYRDHADFGVPLGEELPEEAFK